MLVGVLCDWQLEEKKRDGWRDGVVSARERKVSDVSKELFVGLSSEARYNFGNASEMLEACWASLGRKRGVTGRHLARANRVAAADGVAPAPEMRNPEPRPHRRQLPRSRAREDSFASRLASCSHPPLLLSSPPHPSLPLSNIMGRTRTGSLVLDIDGTLIDSVPNGHLYGVSRTPDCISEWGDYIYFVRLLSFALLIPSRHEPPGLLRVPWLGSCGIVFFAPLRVPIPRTHLSPFHTPSSTHLPTQVFIASCTPDPQPNLTVSFLF